MDQEKHFYFWGDRLYPPSWDFIKAECPLMAQRMIREFKRTGGFIPYDPGFVYLIHAEGTEYYKIGKSKDADRRIMQISPKMPFETRIIKVWRSYFMGLAESWLHSEYEGSRVNGEWFELTPCSISYLLAGRNDPSIVHAYANSWFQILWIDLAASRISPQDRHEASKVEAEFKRLNTEGMPDFYLAFDYGILGWQLATTLDLIQFYLDSISEDFVAQPPAELMQQMQVHLTGGWI